MADKGKYSVMTSAIGLIRSDVTFGLRLSNCWLPASTWVKALKTRWGHIDSCVVIDTRKFNTAMSKSIVFGEMMHRFDGSNLTGVFRIKFQDHFFYFFTDQKRQVSYPSPLNRVWKERVMENAVRVLVIPSTRARPNTVDPTPLIHDDANLNADDQGSPSK